MAERAAIARANMSPDDPDLPPELVMTTDVVRQLEPRARPYKVGVARGMFLLVHPNGGRYWRLKYRFEGREKVLALGKWPDVDCRAAWSVAVDAREQLAQGIDPSAKKQAEKRSSSNSFQAIAEEWIEAGCPTGNRRRSLPKAETINRMRQRLEDYVFPYVGRKPIRSIEVADLKRALDRISARGTHDTAHRTRSVVDRVYRYAIATGRAERNLAADLKGALKLAETKSFAAITEPREFGALLRAIDSYVGQPTTMAALRLAPLLFVRPGELRHAEWQEVDLDSALWSIPADKMKNGLPHTVPLCRQAVEIIRELEPVTGGGRYLFPGLRSNAKPISDMTINAALRRLDYSSDQVVAHGFRTTASTLLHELGYEPDVIEQQLAHRRQGVAAVYNRSHLLKQRTDMMQAWGDYLDTLKRPPAT